MKDTVAGAGIQQGKSLEVGWGTESSGSREGGRESHTSFEGRRGPVRT